MIGIGQRSSRLQYRLPARCTTKSDDYNENMPLPAKLSRPWRLFNATLAVALLGWLIWLPQKPVFSEEGAPKPYNIYLTQDRICRKCTWVLIPDGRVRLINPQGQSAVYTQAEIIGVDNRPVWRRLVWRMNRGNGLAGQVINPAGYDPWNPKQGLPFPEYEDFEPLPVYPGH
ncbi:MAG: hypothetical protein AB7P76_06725 [Candidatus Melainabacteria bacterium]